MKWLLALGAAVFVVYWLVRRRAASSSVLEARIATSDALHYSVAFVELCPGVQPVEYVWLCILLAAKLLYNMGKDQKQAEAKTHLLDIIRTLGATDLWRAGNLVVEALEPIEIATKEASGSRLVTARVIYVNPMLRHIWTTIPLSWFEHQFPHSFLAVVQTSLPKLNDILRDRLQGALAKMSELYDGNEWDPASLKSLAQVPSLAFWDARIIVRDRNSVRPV